MEFREAFEESLAALGIDNLDDNPDDIPVGTVEETEDESPEDEADASEEVEGSEDGEDGQKPAGSGKTKIIDISEGAELRLPDGTVVPADKAVLMQADYTRKTQELAEQRKQFEAEISEFEQVSAEVNETYENMRAWYETRAANPSGWIAEIASQAEDATATIAKALYDLAQAGVLDKKFVETFGIESGEIAETAQRSKVESEVAQLRRSLEEREAIELERERLARQQDLVKKRAAVYEHEWEQIKADNALDFSDVADEVNAKRELLQFALENKLGKSLIDAYDLLMVRKSKSGLLKNPQDSEVAAKKRASRAVTPKTSVSAASPRKKNISDREAILEAMEGLSL
jgi:hypothetical protein